MLPAGYEVASIMARRVMAGDIRVRQGVDERVADPLDRVIGVDKIGRATKRGYPVRIRTQRFPDGLHYGPRDRCRVLA